MRALVIGLLCCGAYGCGCHPAAPAMAPPTNVEAPQTTGATCGGETCAPTEICVPGGPSQNGIGETIELPPTRCVALPASCNGVASCGCLDQFCALGGCVSTDGGTLLCLAG